MDESANTEEEKPLDDNIDAIGGGEKEEGESKEEEFDDTYDDEYDENYEEEVPLDDYLEEYMDDDVASYKLDVNNPDLKAYEINLMSEFFEKPEKRAF